MSKDTASPNNYQLPSSEFLKVHEDEPAYKQFLIKDEIMQLPLPLKRRIILNYIVQLQSKGYCNASNDWFAKKTRTADKDSISTQMVALEEAGLVKINRIYEDGTMEIKERRVRPTRRLELMLVPLPPKVQVGVPPKVQEIVPKGTETSIVPKRKKKYKPIKPSWKDI